MSDESDDFFSGYPIPGPMRYFGGKGFLAKYIVPLIPPGGRPYLEPFAGAASILFHRAPAPVEVINDIDENIVTVFRVLQDEHTAERLRRKLFYTPYSRAEFGRAIELLNSPGELDAVDRAWAVLVVYNQSTVQKLARNESEWSRAKSNDTGGLAMNVNTWLKRLCLIETYHQRLMHCQIDRQDGIKAIEYWDSDDAVIYCDPPYVLESRSDKSPVYAYEPDSGWHERLIDVLLEARGAVVVSGYPHPIYDRLSEAGWQRIEFDVAVLATARTETNRIIGPGAMSDPRHRRTEVIWRNPKAAAAAPYTAEESNLYQLSLPFSSSSQPSEMLSESSPA